MKKFFLLFAAAACAHFSSMAQGASMTITNNTGCLVTYHLYAQDNMCYPPSGPATVPLTTNTYPVAPGGSVYFTNVATLNGCGPATYWNIVCSGGPASPPAPPSCVGAGADGPTGSWDWADVDVNGTPFAQLGRLGTSVQVGTCNGNPVTVTWTRNPGGNIAIDFN